MLTCYIIDDEDRSIELLRSYIEQAAELSLLGWSNDPIKGLHEVTSLNPDILFLDVDMPVLSGIDLFRITGNRFDVIFTTGHMQYAVDAYDLAATDFLLKPIRFERFLQTVQRLQLKEASRKEVSEAQPDGAVFLQTGQKGKFVRTLITDIVWAESLNNYLKIHATKNTFTVYMSLRELLGQLPSGQFERVHRSYVINLARITEMEGNRVWLEGGHEIPIGAQFRDHFFKRITRQTLRK